VVAALSKYIKGFPPHIIKHREFPLCAVFIAC